jgi:integrase
VDKRQALAQQMRDVRPKHILKLVTEVALPYEGARTPDGKLSPKMVAGVYRIRKTMFRDARIDEVVDVDPCVLPKDTLSRQPRRARKPYGATAALASMGEPVRLDRRVWNALAFYTGMREGEVCGRRWRDWDPQCFPLGALTCATQYQNQPLKTEKHGGERPRVIPVHPELDRILREWWETGFEMIFCRRPSLEDFIVPHEKIGCHTKSSSRAATRRGERAAPRRAWVTSPSTPRVTRSISRTGRGGARKEVLERVTHSARGRRRPVHRMGLAPTLRGGGLPSVRGRGV